jgi:hypothetical protein
MDKLFHTLARKGQLVRQVEIARELSGWLLRGFLLRHKFLSRHT